MSARPAGFGLLAGEYEPLALASGLLRSKTSALGLSLGDRACLALALQVSLPVVTADRAWKRLKLGIAIRAIR